MAKTLDLDARQAAAIAEQNDRFRKTIGPIGDIKGRCVVTQALAALGPDLQLAALREVAELNTFTPENAPYDLHEMGSVQIGEHRIFWRIDLYDIDYHWGSERPVDPAATRRVLTIMLAGDLRGGGEKASFRIGCDRDDGFTHRGPFGFMRPGRPSMLW